MSQIDQLFTPASLLTLQGSTAATLLVPNAASLLFGDQVGHRLRLWIGFAVAMALSVGAAASAAGPNIRWVVAFFNGLLVFMAAMGLNESGSPRVGDGVLRGATGRRRLAPFRSWLRD